MSYSMLDECCCLLMVAGDLDEIGRFDRTFSQTGVYRLDNLYPMPITARVDMLRHADGIDNPDTLASFIINQYRQGACTREEAAIALLSLPDIVGDCYSPEHKVLCYKNWCRENWGTLGECTNMGGLHLLDYDPPTPLFPMALYYFILAPWPGVPDLWLRKVAADWPELALSLAYCSYILVLIEDGSGHDYLHTLGPAGLVYGNGARYVPRSREALSGFIHEYFGGARIDLAFDKAYYYALER